jgi:hypothetical protein
VIGLFTYFPIIYIPICVRFRLKHFAEYYQQQMAEFAVRKYDEEKTNQPAESRIQKWEYGWEWELTSQWGGLDTV